MDNDLRELEALIDDLNGSITDLRDKQVDIKDSDLPSNMNLMLSGVSNSRAVDFLFSKNLDKVMDQLMSLVMSGDIEKILSSEAELKEILKAVGFGDDSFKGPISRSVMRSIKLSTDSKKFNSTTNSIKKVMLVMKNLKRQGKHIVDKEQKRKYDEAVYAIKQVVKMVSKVYKNRKLIKDKFYKGVNHIVNEENDMIILESIF